LYSSPKDGLNAVPTVKITLGTPLTGVPANGVPAGNDLWSMSGPLLFVRANVIKVTSSHGVCINAYADDMQTFVSFAAPDYSGQVVSWRWVCVWGVCVGVGVRVCVADTES